MFMYLLTALSIQSILIIAAIFSFLILSLNLYLFLFVIHIMLHFLLLYISRHFSLNGRHLHCGIPDCVFLTSVWVLFFSLEGSYCRPVWSFQALFFKFPPAKLKKKNLYSCTNLIPLLSHNPFTFSIIMPHIFNKICPLWLVRTCMITSPL